MNVRDLGAAAIGLLAHSFAWIAQTEQIWMPMAGAYVRYLSPVYDLPDLRGPFAFLTLVYIGLRLGDLLNKRKDIELEETL